MPSVDLIPLLVQTGYAGLFVFMLVYVLRDVKQAREAWEREREAWTKERKERHDEFVTLHKAHLEMQREILDVVGSLKIVIQQWMDQGKPPFTDWDGETERRKKR